MSLPRLRQNEDLSLYFESLAIFVRDAMAKDLAR